MTPVFSTSTATLWRACAALLVLAWAVGRVYAQDADGDLLLDGVDPKPLDAFNGGWQYLPGAGGTGPLSRHEGDGCQALNRFMVFGGRETALVETYDPEANLWKKSGTAPLAFHHVQSVVVGGLVYVIGAFSGSYPDEVPVPDVYIHDPSRGTWTKGPAIPVDRRRGATAGAAYGGKIYLAGGNTKGHRAGWVAWFDEFDPVSGSWRRLPDAPRPRDHHRAVVAGDRLFLVSGRRTSFGDTGGVRGNTVPEVDVYDFTSGVWSQLPDPIPTPRAGCALMVHGRDVVVAGGEAEGGAVAKVEALDLETGDWRSFPDLKQARNGPVGFSIGNRIFVSGGQNPENASQEVLLVPPRPVAPTPFVISGSPPNVILSRVKSVNCGGRGAGSFVGDAGFSGGVSEETTMAVAGSETAPEAVFKTRRTGECVYEVEGLVPLALHRLDLNFAELDSPQGTFAVWVNGEPVLQDFDVVREAAGVRRGVTRSFTLRTGADGRMRLELRAGAGEPFLNGWTLFRATYPAGAAASSSLARPNDVLAKVGDPASFGALVNGRAPARYQWKRNGETLKGATAPVLKLGAVGMTHAGEYDVTADGKISSARAKLVVVGRPVYSSVVVRGQTTTLRIPFAGAGASFQWFKDGAALTDSQLRRGSRSALLEIRGFAAADCGTYSCEVRAFGDTEVFDGCKLRLMEIPVVTTPPPRAGIIGAIRWQIAASEGWTKFLVKGLPEGLRYDAKQRVVYGTPVRAGNYAILITPSNPAGIGPVQRYLLCAELPDPAFRGNWVGLSDRSAAINGLLGGGLRLTVGSTGLVTGVFRNGGPSYRFSGRLAGVPGGDASFRTVIDRGPSLPLLLHLTFPKGGDTITGKVTMGGNEARITARRGAVPAPGVTGSVESLQCVFRLADDTLAGNPAVPQGTGWMRISRSVGTSSITLSGTGRLADGTDITFSVEEGVGGDFPIFMVYPAFNGSLSGWGRVSQGFAPWREFAGSFQWRKLRPAGSLDSSYRAGFNVWLNGEGESRAPRSPDLSWPDVIDLSGNAEVVFADGGLTWSQEAELNQTFSLAPNGEGRFPGGPLSPAWLSMRVDAARGTFSGNVRLKEGLVIRNFGYEGILINGIGEGFFNLRQAPLTGPAPVWSGGVRILPY